MNRRVANVPRGGAWAKVTAWHIEDRHAPRQTGCSTPAPRISSDKGACQKAARTSQYLRLEKHLSPAV